ncbi:MAG: restriction endonuclease [Gammaproteobacteria bacterium]|nr:restriction endonuclease [Gammaproteobacteria bacterium]
MNNQSSIIYDDINKEWNRAIQICISKTKLIRTQQKDQYRFSASMENVLSKFIEKLPDCWSLTTANMKPTFPDREKFILIAPKPVNIPDGLLELMAEREVEKPEYMQLLETKPEFNVLKYKNRTKVNILPSIVVGIVISICIGVLLGNNHTTLAFFMGLISAVLFFLSNRDKKIKKAWNEDLKNWEEQSASIERKNKELANKYKNNLEKAKNRMQAENKKELELYEECNANLKKKYDKRCSAISKKLHDLVLILKHKYEHGNANDICSYANLMLSCLALPAAFPHEYKTVYIPETKILAIDYWLPSQENIPGLKEEKKLKTTHEIKPIRLSKTAYDTLYDSVIYQLIFIIFSTLYTSDKKLYYNAINFNGWVNNINLATGREKNTCIVSINISREKFNELNLRHIAPKETFRYLKGVGSPKLHNVVAVKPIMMLNKNDPRFIGSYDVAYTLNEGLNLAAMDWEDFEHLVREVFEKKLGKSGIEIKVTQSSRDKGVDAVAFDPDPITGGKIIIQAKRYTNVVGVSAVRDLYGTIMNEGANKGILVTTSNYGKDSYEFAQDKPITLIRGAELLALLEEFGYKSHIDLVDAKTTLKNKKA